MTTRLKASAATLIALALAGCSQSEPSMPNPNAFYQVDADTAGVWETARPEDGAKCRWLRAKSPNITIADTIATGKVNPDLMTPDGTAKVTLESGDWFIYWDCSPWTFTGR